ncbi:MAG TPA: hypothetical protein PKD53_07075 [Chloroflexaceae bacterium]|nr:hypothetical protein [Chloroflexaceae bacterium]
MSLLPALPDADLRGVLGLDGHLRELAGPWAQALGWSAVELGACPWIGQVHPDDQPHVTATIAALAPGLEAGFAARMLRRDSTYARMRWWAARRPTGLTVALVAALETPERRAHRPLPPGE